MASRIKMSEYHIPLHIQEEIMKRLPVKPLVQFRSVSKTWKSLIDSSEFIVAHSFHRHTQPHHLLISYENMEESVDYVGFVDDETLLQQRGVKMTFLQPVKQLHLPKIVGTSYGLVCFYSPHSKLTIVWNPSIRKLKSIIVNVPTQGQTFVGFGVCPVTSDPKIVTITQSWDKSDIETNYHSKVRVYTLSSGKWRTMSNNLPTKPIQDWCRVVTIDADGFIYWCAQLHTRNMIMSFDVTNESFQVIDLPHCLARCDPVTLYVYKLRESLAMVQYQRNNTYTIWMMEDCVQRSFTKLFTITRTYNLPFFRKSGVPIMEVCVGYRFKLVVYEPHSTHNNVLDIPGDPFFFTVKSYVESLFLLGRSDCISY